MKTRRRADAIGSLLKYGAAGELGIFEILNRSEVLVDERGVGQRPQVLGRLQFGGIRRQKEQMDVVGHAEFDAGMPPRTIEHQHDLLGGTGSGLACKLREFHLKDGNTDRRCQVEDRASGGGMHKPDQIAPGKAVLHRGDWPLTNWRPDLAEQWLQADTVFVGGPHFNLRLGERVSDGPYERAELFLNSVCCSRLARA